MGDPTLAGAYVYDDEAPEVSCETCGEVIEIGTPAIDVPAGLGPPRMVVTVHLGCAVQGGLVADAKAGERTTDPINALVADCVADPNARFRLKVALMSADLLAPEDVGPGFVLAWQEDELCPCLAGRRGR